MKSKRGDKKCRKTKRRNVSKTRKRAQKGGILDVGTQLTIWKGLQNRNLGSMLQKVCRDPNNCLAFGVYDEYIKAHFDDFSDLAQVDMPNVKKIGSVSANGFVLELPFVKNGFKAYTVLKCALSESADNLFYEFLVGKYFINQYTKKLPCFVETYDLYDFEDEYWHEFAYKSPKLAVGELKIRRIKTTPTFHKKDLDDDFEQSCLLNKRLCILIQHFNNVWPLYLWHHHFQEFNSDICSSLYQVFYALTMLKDKFTHYDLHGGNILLYKPFGKQMYIRMRYHYGDGKPTVEFKTEYVVKIIDYGRSFVNIDGVTTNEIMDKVCKLKSCDPMCGKNFGYDVIQGSKVEESNLSAIGLNPTKLNNSHDLRFVKETFTKNLLNAILPQEPVPKISVTYEHEFATRPAIGNGSIGDIKSVVDMHQYLVEHVMDHPIIKQRNDTKYDSSWTEAATMDIYDDGRDYVFTLTA